MGTLGQAWVVGVVVGCNAMHVAGSLGVVAERVWLGMSVFSPKKDQ